MKNYSVLAISITGYHGHAVEFVNNLKKTNPFVDVTLAISGKLDGENEGYLSEDIRTIIYVGHKNMPSIIDSIVKGFYFYFQFLFLFLKGGVNIVNIHYPSGALRLFMPLLRLISPKIVITPWGSDVLRVTEESKIKDLQKVYSYANYVTVSQTGQIGKCLIEKFNVNPEKLIALSWGGEFFDYIQENQDNITTEEAKERFGVNGRYVITCGYNPYKEQNHEEIIDAIYKVRDQLPENLTLLFPFTYGRMKDRDQYIEHINNKCKDLGIDYVSVMDHLDMADLLKLRMATDIFVHVQDTDAGSRCVAEYVLCNKKLVHGAWVKYRYLEDYKPSCYFPVENMEQLGNRVVNAYQSPIDELSQDVRNILVQRGWKYKMKQWNDFFESLV